MKQPILIDEIKDLYGSSSTQIQTRRFSGWFIAKPMFDNPSLLTRIYHAYLVLIGKAKAVRFAEDCPPKCLDKYVEKCIDKRINSKEEEKKDHEIAKSFLSKLFGVKHEDISNAINKQDDERVKKTLDSVTR